MPTDAPDGATSRDSSRAVEPYRPRHLRHAPYSARRRRGPIIAGAAVGVIAVGVGAVAAMYNDLQSNITTEDVTHLLDEEGRPTVHVDPDDPNAGQAMNILVMGSDSRGGDNAAQGGEAEVEGMRSDTTMIMHISSDRSRVDIVSIPRDTLVRIPSCILEDGTRTEPVESGMFNSAFHVGGQHGDVSAAAACTIATVEELTDIRIDDYMVVDFAGFIGVVEALDGVPMYVDEDVADPGANLYLDQGCQILDGEDALGFARARQTLGDGSDTSRIGRQQELVGAIARDVLSSRVLYDLPRLYSVLDAGTQTLTTSPDMGSITNLAGLAVSLRGLDSSGVGFVTMPFEPAGYRVVPAAGAADVWDALREDRPLPGVTTAEGEPGETTTDGPEDPAAEAPSPDDVAGFGRLLALEAQAAAAAAQDEAGADGAPGGGPGDDATASAGGAGGAGDPTDGADEVASGSDDATEDEETPVPVCTR